MDASLNDGYIFDLIGQLPIAVRLVSLQRNLFPSLEAYYGLLKGIPFHKFLQEIGD
jgi:hypothetical protein